MAEPSGVQADFAAMTASRNGHPLEMSNGAIWLRSFKFMLLMLFNGFYLNKHTHIYIYMYINKYIYIYVYT